ncbi:uncharacterized protein LOC123658228 [Melitaea cinxia]|uniref:uncharacterized protein LOC123658228 n=1 Tax=Melitaea cinxia TaxID=113334 RepID=UPI001E2724B9|nr:uncharacterized protein LOC123658228 [Melitaea cinxia]
MSPLLYFALGVIQLSSVLATDQIPLKCFLQNYNLFSIFSKTSYDVDPNSNTQHFGTVVVDSAGFNKDGWNHEAKNIKYYGLDDAILDYFGFNFTSNVLQLTFHTDMVVTYDYKSSGSVFSLPLNGQGFAEVTLKNIQVGYTIPFDIKEVDDKKFIQLKNFDYWYDIKDKAELKFSSHNQDKELSDSIQQQLNQKWKYVTSHFGKVFYDSLAEKIFSMFKDYVMTLPLKDFAKC